MIVPRFNALGRGPAMTNYTLACVLHVHEENQQHCLLLVIGIEPMLSNYTLRIYLQPHHMKGLAYHIDYYEARRLGSLDYPELQAV